MLIISNRIPRAFIQQKKYENFIRRTKSCQCNNDNCEHCFARACKCECHSERPVQTKKADKPNLSSQKKSWYTGKQSFSDNIWDI